MAVRYLERKICDMHFSSCGRQFEKPAFSAVNSEYCVHWTTKGKFGMKHDPEKKRSSTWRAGGTCLSWNGYVFCCFHLRRPSSSLSESHRLSSVWLELSNVASVHKALTRHHQ